MKGAPRGAWWLKGMTEVRGSTKADKVVLVNYTPGMEIGVH